MDHPSLPGAQLHHLAFKGSSATQAQNEKGCHQRQSLRLGLVYLASL